MFSNFTTVDRWKVSCSEKKEFRFRVGKNDLPNNINKSGNS